MPALSHSLPPQLTALASSISFCRFSKISSSSLSFSNSFWQRLSSSLRKFTVTVGLSVVGTLSCRKRCNPGKDCESCVPQKLVS